MGNKVTDELLTMVRSIVGQDYSDMDIIRALHMSNNDPTAAINIIFDTPSFRKPEIPKNPEVSDRNSKAVNQAGGVRLKENGNNVTQDCILVSHSRNGMENKGGSESGKHLNKCSSSMGGEWWFVGCSEVSGLSTCKGRKLRYGDEVNFTFPSERRVGSPSAGRFGGGRGRGAVACSEIVRFSTKDCGEVFFHSNLFPFCNSLLDFLNAP